MFPSIQQCLNRTDWKLQQGIIRSYSHKPDTLSSAPNSSSLEPTFLPCRNELIDDEFDFFSSPDRRKMSGYCIVWITSGNNNLPLRSTFICHLEPPIKMLHWRDMCAVFFPCCKLDIFGFVSRGWFCFLCLQPLGHRYFFTWLCLHLYLHCCNANLQPDRMCANVPPCTTLIGNLSSQEGPISTNSKSMTEHRIQKWERNL